MIREYSKILMLLVLSIFLTGCWDYADINEKSIVISLGVDKVDGKYEFSTEIAKLTPLVGEDKAQPASVYSDTSLGDTFEEARVDYDVKRPFPTFLGATRVVIFSKGYAKEGVEPYLNRINNIFDYRKTVLAVVSQDPPRDLLKIKVESDISVGFHIEDNINSLAHRGTALYPTIGDLLSDVALGEVGYLLPYVGIERNSIAYLGLAVMKDSKLIDIIDVNDTVGILYMLSDNPQFSEAIPSEKDPKNKLSLRTSIKKRKIKTDYVDGKAVINVSLDLKTQLQYQYYIEPISDAEIKKIEDIIAEKVKNDILAAIEKSQKKYKCDIFEFARYFRADNPKIYERIKWREEYPDAIVNVDVKAKIVNKNLTDPNVKREY